MDVPIGSARGKLVAGKSKPLDLELDRVLVRSAANLVGTALETAYGLEAAKRKGEFLAMLGHELRNPLAPILTAVELLGGYTEAAREREVIERHTRHLHPGADRRRQHRCRGAARGGAEHRGL